MISDPRCLPSGEHARSVIDLASERKGPTNWLLGCLSLAWPGFIRYIRIYIYIHTYIHTYKDTFIYNYIYIYIHRVCISIDGVTYQSNPYNPHSSHSLPSPSRRPGIWNDETGHSDTSGTQRAGGCEINGKVCRWEVQWCSIMLTNKNENSTIKKHALKSTLDRFGSYDR